VVFGVGRGGAVELAVGEVLRFAPQAVRDDRSEDAALLAEA
jgi:hypothetical protein